VSRQQHGFRLVESRKKTSIAHQLAIGLAVFTSRKPHLVMLPQLGK